METNELFYIEKTGNKSGTLKRYSPYPCDFDRGIIDSIAIKTTSNNNAVTIKHLPNSCRSKGDEFCTFSVKCES